MRLFLSGSLLLLLAACAQPTPTVAAPQPGSASLAVDLGGSSRIPRTAASAGEGEGYGMAPAVAAASVDHSRMDHSKMDHSVMSGTNQAPAAAPQVAQAASVQGSGTVNSVDAAGHKVNLNHNAIPAIGWPAMTMDFAVAPSVDLRALKPGTRVNFMMQRGGDGLYVIHSITPAGGQ
ncbi:Copper binding protein CusF [Rhodospirillales bacterium URHD0017]|nr:Copper binding protein CusF [Rhodospirillales bacterium URHD0017]